MHWPHDHTGIGISECLIESCPLHSVLDGTNGLLHVELHAPESGLLLLEIIELLLDLGVQLEFFAKM